MKYELRRLAEAVQYATAIAPYDSDPDDRKTYRAYPTSRVGRNEV